MVSLKYACSFVIAEQIPDARFSILFVSFFEPHEISQQTAVSRRTHMLVVDYCACLLGILLK